jgi:hypothetical protein
MRRLFWLAMGLAMGALIVRKLTRATEQLAPDALARRFADGLSELAASLRDFSADVREAMTEREAELRAGTGLDGSLGSAAADPQAAPPAATQAAAPATAHAAPRAEDER